MENMKVFVTQFVDEGNEKADQLEHCLIHLEKDPSSKEVLKDAFRALHSIKGATSFLNFARLGALAHSGETLLARLRDGQLLLNSEITSVLLSLVDAIREILGEIAATGQEGDGQYAALETALARLQKGGV
jgi:two-component system, chemotaxis family, sensor kinase CheA